MTKREIIEELQDKIHHNRIGKISELEKLCEPHGIDAFEDVILPMGFNVCEKCGDICDSEMELFWIDGFDWDEENNPKDKAILKALLDEPVDYCAVCYPCLHSLANKGRDSEDVAKAKDYYTREYVIQVREENRGEPVCFDEFYWNDWQEIRGLLK